MAADPGAAVIRSFDAENTQRPGTALSIAYVIAPDGHITYAHTNSDNDPVRHVAAVTEAIESWAARN